MRWPHVFARGFVKHVASERCLEEYSYLCNTLLLLGVLYTDYMYVLVFSPRGKCKVWRARPRSRTTEHIPPTQHKIVANFPASTAAAAAA